MRIILKEAPNPKYVRVCLVGGNLTPGREAYRVEQGDDAKLMAFCKADFDGPMNVRQQPTLLTAIRIGANIITPGENQWEAARDFLAGLEDAAAYAESLGYSLDDWI